MHTVEKLNKHIKKRKKCYAIESTVLDGKHLFN